MSNEKLREALRELMSIVSIHQKATRNNFAWAEMDFAREALATTEPEPTGMPELHPVAHIELGDDSHDVVTFEAAKAHGEQCWKAGYKHGTWGDKPEPTSKQPLQVDPAVNQQLTTEPVDEREAFEKVFPTPSHCQRCGDGYAATSYNAWEAHNHIERWKGWQARAAMAQVSDINVVESFTNVTKDALMAGRAYAQEALIRFDDAYDRHPSTEPERNAILTDIQLIDAAMAKGVKG